MTKEYQKLFNEMEQCFHREKQMVYLIEEINQDNEIVWAWQTKALPNTGIKNAILEGHTIKITQYTLQNPEDYRGLISDLSTGQAGQYYDSATEWYNQLTKKLSRFSIDELPHLLTQAGHHSLHIHNTKYYVHFTWYEMFETDHWEIICYLTKGD